MPLSSTTLGLSDDVVATIKGFIEAPFEYPAWSPRSSNWNGSDLSRVNALRIPRTSEVDGRVADPDSILYGLGRLGQLDPAFPERLRRFTNGEDHLLLVNTSGSGKTKLALETLYAHWGLFLTAHWHPVSDPYGSSDLSIALNFFDARTTCRRVPLAKKNCNVPPPELAFNQDILAQEMDLLILARLQLLDAFMELALNAGLSDDDARIKWFWLQIRPIELAGLDIWTIPLNAVRSLERAEVTRRIRRLEGLHRDRLQFVVLDEAQILCRLHECCFASANFREHRPMLRQMLVCLASSLPRSRLISCGTEIDPEIFDDAVRSSASQIRTWRKFSSLGQFALREDIRRYIVHFFGDSLSLDDIELAYAYFRGRRRFLAVLVQRTLLHGIPQFTNVLDSILSATTGLRRPGCSSVRVDVNLGPVTQDGTIEYSKMAAQLRWAAYANVTQYAAPIFRENARQLVGLAVAHFLDDDMSEARVDEPVILLNLARWLRTSPRYATGAMIERRMRDPAAGDLRGCGFAHSIALFLWRRFGSGLRLADIASFPGPAPRWAAEAAPFALSSMDGDSRTVEPIKRLDGPLVHGTDRSDDVFAWFERSRSPFLIPDSAFGPQLIFVLDALDGPRLVFVHLEPFDTVRPHRHNQVTPRDPKLYYASSRAARKQFQQVLATFSNKTTAKSTRSPAYNSLQIYAFAEVNHSRDARRPPTASLRLHVILNRPEPESSDESSDDDFTEDASSDDYGRQGSTPGPPPLPVLSAEDIEYREAWLELRAADIGEPIR